jgi:hypothetical protein
MPTERPPPSEEHYDTVDPDNMGREWLARATDALTPQETARAELGLVDPSVLSDEIDDPPASSDSQWEAAFQYAPLHSNRWGHGWT